MPVYKTGTTCKTTKGYPRCTAGPLRNLYLHRIVAAAMLGRPLNKDEEVHHSDSDKRNFWFTNLLVLGSKDHGWVSAKQAWFMRTRDARLKKEWDEFMAEEAAHFQKKVQEAKAAGKKVRIRDGGMQRRWEKRKVA